MNNISPDYGRPDTFGRRIRRARRAKEWSLEHLASKLGVTKVSVWGWEAGRTRPRSHLLEPLSEALEVPLETLLMGSMEAAGSDLRAVIADCQSRIGAFVGVQPEHVEIKITFVGRDS